MMSKCASVQGCAFTLALGRAPLEGAGKCASVRPINRARTLAHLLPAAPFDVVGALRPAHTAGPV
jgi:hypothetical protein